MREKEEQGRVIEREGEREGGGRESDREREGEREGGGAGTAINGW